MPELLKHGITTKVTPRDIKDSLEKAMMIKGSEYEKMTTNAYEFVKNNCTKERMRENIQEIYEEILN